MNTQTQRWPGFKYEQVPGLANRYIARWLRTQRKNMRAFFLQHGLMDLVLKMDSIRKSNAGMMEKNRRFQGVLDEYAKLANPGAAPVANAEADHTEVPGSPAVDVRADLPAGPVEGVRAEDSGPGADAGGSVSGLESPGDAGPVIEE